MKAKPQEIHLPYNFTPRSYQVPFLDAMETQGKRRALILWHRRTGKDKLCLNFTVGEAWLRVGLYAYFFPTYKQGRKVLWNGIDKDGFPFMKHFPEEIRANTNDTEMRIKLINGSIFQIFGTDDYDSFLGANPVGCVFSEYALQVPYAWDYIRPILKENGGWAVFNSTPRGRNHLFKLAKMAERNPNWFFQALTVNDTRLPDGNPVITPKMIEEEREEGMSESLIQQEYYLSFDAALDACFFGDTLARHTETEDGIRGDLVDNKNMINFIPNPRGILEIWEQPYNRKSDWDQLYWKKRYAIGSDIAEGLERDFSVAYVYDRVTFEFVARMRSNKIDAHFWGDLLNRLSLYYDRAIIVPERNGSGITTCKRLVELKANYYFNTTPAKAGKSMTHTVGWVETKESKNNMCGDLKEYFKNTPGRVRDSLLLAECSTFVIKENEKIEADSDFQDDAVVSAGLALQGSYFCAESAKAYGEVELEKKRQKDMLDKLDSVSKVAVKEYSGIIDQLQNEYSDDWF